MDAVYLVLGREPGDRRVRNPGPVVLQAWANPETCLRSLGATNAEVVEGLFGLGRVGQIELQTTPLPNGYARRLIQVQLEDAP